MVWYAEQYNQTGPAKGISGLLPFCIPTLAGCFLMDNVMPKGYYAEPYKAKRVRLDKMKETKCKCEVCGEDARIMHHIDGDHNNHEKQNLASLCSHCHSVVHNREYGRTSKLKRKYGYSIGEIVDRLAISKDKVYYLERQGVLKAALRTGKIKPKTRTRDSFFYRTYGFSVGQIAGQTDLTVAQVTKLHRQRRLKDFLRKCQKTI